jgi:hypothetical protein
MQVGVRSYLIGGITAAGFGALAFAPLPAAAPNVQVPKIDDPAVQNTALTDVLNPQFAIDQALTLYDGGTASILVQNKVLPPLADPATLGRAVLETPTFAPAILNSGFNAIQGVGTGVPGTATPEVPGSPSQAVESAPGSPRSWLVTSVDTSGVPTSTDVSLPTGPLPNGKVIPNPFESAVDTVQDNLVTNDVPGARVLQSVTVESCRVGTSIVQAQGLVRDATVNAVQGTVNAATTGGNVGGAAQTGADNIGKSVFGDPSIQYKVDPTTGKPVSASTEGSVDSIHKLGAIGTVSSATQTAAKNVGDSISAN